MVGCFNAGSGRETNTEQPSLGIEQLTAVHLQIEYKKYYSK